jgi:hypothetical protein
LPCVIYATVIHKSVIHQPTCKSLAADAAVPARFEPLLPAAVAPQFSESVSPLPSDQNGFSSGAAVVLRLKHTTWEKKEKLLVFHDRCINECKLSR